MALSKQHLGLPTVSSKDSQVCCYFIHVYIWFFSAIYVSIIGQQGFWITDWTWYPWHQISWWRHQMETFSALLAICAGNSPVPGEFPTQRLVTRSFDVFFDLHLNKRLSKQSWGRWLETLSCPLWRHRNGKTQILATKKDLSHQVSKLVVFARFHVKGLPKPPECWGILNYENNWLSETLL